MFVSGVKNGLARKVIRKQKEDRNRNGHKPRPKRRGEEAQKAQKRGTIKLEKKIEDDDDYSKGENSTSRSSDESFRDSDRFSSKRPSISSRLRACMSLIFSSTVPCVMNL